MEATISDSIEARNQGAVLLELDHGTVEVDTMGRGPDFVVIHSLLTGPEAFEGIAQSLSRRHTVHRIYLPWFWWLDWTTDA